MTSFNGVVATPLLWRPGKSKYSVLHALSGPQGTGFNCMIKDTSSSELAWKVNIIYKDPTQAWPREGAINESFPLCLVLLLDSASAWSIILPMVRFKDSPRSAHTAYLVSLDSPLNVAPCPTNFTTCTWQKWSSSFDRAWWLLQLHHTEVKSTEI